MINLGQAITTDGITTINFFNGRLLSGEDLSRDRRGSRELLRRLGESLGDGVAFGLGVAESVGKSSLSLPVITVSQGLAVNRNGRPLALTADTDLQLAVAPAAAAPPPTAGGFAGCEPPVTNVVATTGVYLLLIAPARADQGRAPVTGLNNVVAPCNTNYAIEGVQFRLVRLPLTDAELGLGGLLRNHVAYRFFGTPDAAYQQSLGDPFDPSPGDYGLLAWLRGQKLLSDCDVPLAVISWAQTAGIQFIDLWSVRRPVTRRDAEAPWSVLAGARRRAEAEAMFLQFEDHVRDLVAPGQQPAGLSLGAQFAYLPPAGLLPVRSPVVTSGLDLLTFFGELASLDVAMIDAVQLRALVHESFSHEPIDLAHVQRIQLYLLWETVRAQDNGQRVPLAAVFANPTLPYRGVARFTPPPGSPSGVDYSRWGRSRFARRVI